VPPTELSPEEIWTCPVERPHPLRRRIRARMMKSGLLKVWLSSTQ
jgi:hypothetical protein